MLDTIYYLLPYLSANIHERVIDKYCKRELLQDPEKEESVNYCDRNYKILADYQYCSVFIVGYDFCVVVPYPWSYRLRYNLKCCKCHSHFDEVAESIVYGANTTSCRFCSKRFVDHE